MDVTAILALILLFGLMPSLGVGVWGFTQWLQFKEKQQKMGASTHELEKTVEALQRDRQSLVRRLETLEAIVTSEEWDAVEGAPGRRLLDETEAAEEQATSRPRSNERRRGRS